MRTKYTCEITCSENSAWKNFLRHVPLIVKYINDAENLGPIERYVILGAYRAGLSGVPPYAYEVGGKMFDSPMIFLAWNCGDDLRRTEDLRRFGYLKPYINLIDYRNEQLGIK